MDPPGSTPDRPILIGGDEDDANLQRALAMSLQDGPVKQDDDDDDDELQRALALSLTPQKMASPPKVLRPSSSVSSEEEAAVKAARALSLQDDTPPLQIVQPLVLLETEAIDQCYQSGENYTLADFHSIMWDAAMTTDNDKSRWVEQGFDVRGGETAAVEVSSAAASAATINEEERSATEDDRLAALAESHLPWGLVQNHGGPCGVLAAVQAEILKSLLWGSVTENSWLEALARAIGAILARAALTEPVEQSRNQPITQGERPELVRLVLPKNRDKDQPLSWGDFAPWSPMETESTTTKIAVYSIPASLRSRADAKRQKMDTLEQMDRLAETVAAFLLQAPTGGVPPIHHFRRAGGVMLLVMSTVASRTTQPRQLQEEFDDPAGTRLTAQFGHCSQELINLLLTGQAVSNVFDNTLKPSGDMICRGISKRPDIGYLSQLESLRYCQVGSYYKSPRYPIWVIGSTSHFTILFGPMGGLQESQSDLLLEKCRRAFKSVEGGDENGFIATDRLGHVLDELDLHQEDEGNLSLLAKTLEVNGAGIILWDDFWKTTSRLLTGASLEAVLAAKSDEPPALMPALDACSTPSTSSTPAAESDEEMARRLANEWGWDDGDGNSIGAVASGSPVNLPSDDDAPPPLEAADKDSKPAATGAGKKFHFETFGDTFSLYHYNGLRGGVLTQCRVTRLTPEEAVGASVALNRNVAPSGQSGSADLEDVIRTKWPSCAVNWMGKKPPYID